MPKKLETEKYEVKVARRIGGKLRKVGDTVDLTPGTAAHLVASHAVVPVAAATPAASTASSTAKG